MEKNRFDRREMLKKIGRTGVTVAGLSLAGASLPTGAMAQSEKSKVIVAHNGTMFNKILNSINKLGGVSKFIKKGAKVVIKPNGAWARPINWAANTHPMVIDSLIKIAKKAGAGSITVIEHTCDNPRLAFEKNGLAMICKKNNVPLIDASSGSHYTEISVPKGKRLKKMKALKQVLEADCYINTPVVKVHGGATVTLALKNHMGCVEDRGFWHRNDLHQCIADASTVLKPDLCVVDATRILLTGGPGGPGKTKRIGKVYTSTDIVAVDSTTVRLLGYEPSQIGHIVKAHQLGVGQMDPSKIEVIEI